mmetsp:Transcript_46314/g.130954  ORF Transcript_46314/g.130954 Transcript_46314/m.130954 type:complete len:240 (-) Transcript_46314:335-1054(-)
MGNVSSEEYPDVNWHHRAPHEVRLAATEILKVAGMSGYHTSVIVDDREYFFDSLGIMAAPPLWSHMAGGGGKHPCESRTEVIPLGGALCNGPALVQALHPFFQKGSYDIFYKNCNTFSDAALYFLTRNRLPGHYNRIERLITATNPVSTGLLNRVFRAFVENSTGAACDMDIYVMNPQAEGFSIDTVIATFDESDTESEESDASADSDADAQTCGIVKPNCCYRESPFASLRPRQRTPW